MEGLEIVEVINGFNPWLVILITGVVLGIIFAMGNPIGGLIVFVIGMTISVVTFACYEPKDTFVCTGIKGEYELNLMEYRVDSYLEFDDYVEIRLQER